MVDAQRFPYKIIDSSLGMVDRMPYLPLNLSCNSVLLAGNLARFEARAVVIAAQVNSFPTVDLAFAWTQAPNVPLILGQANFFFEFDVCFFRARSEFEIRPKQVE